MGNIANKGDSPLKLRHTEIIDEYFNNGFNGVKAIKAIMPDESLSYQGLSSMFRVLMKSDKNKAYIESKHNRLKAKADIKNEQVLRELMQWAYSDATEYIGLNPTGLKDLPSDVRRCIQSVKYVKKTFTQRDGTKVVEEFTEVKLIDKTKAIEAIAKHIGFYEVDNSQKRNNFDIKLLNVKTMNNILQAMNSNDKGINTLKD